MTAKEYLGQAYRIDQRINSKMEQIASLNLLAQKATTVSAICPELYKKYPPYGRCYNQNRGYGKRDKRRH